MDTKAILDTVKGLVDAHNASAATPAQPQHVSTPARWAILAMIGGGMFAGGLLIALVVWTLYGHWIENSGMIWRLRFDLVTKIALGVIGLVGLTQLALIVIVTKIGSVSVGGGPFNLTLNVAPADGSPTPVAAPPTIVNTIQNPPPGPPPGPPQGGE